MQVVLVHGAWHDATYWRPLAERLRADGVPAHTVHLPGLDLIGDAGAVADTVDRVDTDGHGVVLVGHSYGGAVIGQTSPNIGVVRHLVFVAAYVLDVGESMVTVGVLDGVREEPPSLLPAARHAGPDGTLLLDPLAAIPALYGRCTPAVQDEAILHLRPQRRSTFTQPASRAAWHTTPSTYVRCLDDRCVPSSHQAAMATRCGAVVDIDADHSPMLSATDELARILTDIAGATITG